MTSPLCVLSTLNSKQGSYEIIAADLSDKMLELRTPNTREQLAIMVMLETPGARLQAIISSNNILKLDMLNERTAQHVVTLNEEARAQLLAAKGLQTLPAIPEITGYQTFVDTDLFAAETILMASGTQGSMISMSQADFAMLAEGCHSMPLGMSIFDLPTTTKSRKQDEDDIYAVIRTYTTLQIKKRLQDTLDIPPLSVTAQKIIKLSASPNAETEDLVKIIELDPSLAAQVVGWASSPYYSAPGRVTSIRDAIVRVLGYDLVLNLALGLAMGQSLKVPSHGACAITLFWRQAIYAALTMEKLNRVVPANKRGQAGFAYLTGLMNNFGYLIFNQIFPSHFATLCHYMDANPHINPMHIQQHLLGITSEQMCAQLAEAWNLPAQINNALRFQQDPFYDGPDANYAHLCFLSTRLLAGMGIGNIPPEVIPESLYKSLELDQEKVDSTMQDLLASQEKIELMLSGLAA